MRPLVVSFDALSPNDRRALLASARQLGIDLTRTARALGWPTPRRDAVAPDVARALDGLCNGFHVIPPPVGSPARDELWEAFFAGVDSVTTRE